jgi:hypothetical protein
MRLSCDFLCICVIIGLYILTCSASALVCLELQEEMGGASDEYEEELPPSDYMEDGILVTALASFSDIRLIRGRAPAAEQGVLS